jgi:hypothetical protein
MVEALHARFPSILMPGRMCSIWRWVWCVDLQAPQVQQGWTENNTVQRSEEPVLGSGHSFYSKYERPMDPLLLLYPARPRLAYWVLRSTLLLLHQAPFRLMRVLLLNVRLRRGITMKRRKRIATNKVGAGRESVESHRY